MPRAPASSTRRKKITAGRVLQVAAPVEIFNNNLCTETDSVRRKRKEYYNKHHDLSLTEMARELNMQKKCAICQKANPRNIDHEHDESKKGKYTSTQFAGRVRAMLCNRCNIIEGRVKHIAPCERLEHWIMKTKTVGEREELRLETRLWEHGYLLDHFKH